MKSLKMAGLAATAMKNNLVELQKPYKLTFSMTYLCQSRCLTCNIWEMKPKGELSLDEIKQFAAKNNYFKWIELTGGEPFLRQDIVDIVKAFYESNKNLYVLTMPTNSLCNFDMVIRKLEQILQLGIPKVSITLSLDGYRELHDKIRGIPGNFDKVMAFGRKFMELQKQYPNLFFVFGFTMSKFNQSEFNRTVEAVQKEVPGVTYNNFHMNLAQISDIYYSNSNLDIKSTRETAAAEIQSLVNNRKFEIGAIPVIENVFLKKLVQYAKTGEVPMKSKSLDASLFMDSFGNVFPSIMWGHKIGNIRESGYDLMPLWHNKEAEYVRTIIKEGKEPKAWHRRYVAVQEVRQRVLRLACQH